MIQLYQWILEYWKLIAPIGLLLVLFSLSGNITKLIRAAKEGLKEALTPLGFVILVTLLIFGYKIYVSLMEIT